MKSKLVVLLAFITFTSTALAAPEAFNFQDPKRVNNVSYRLDAPLESVNGNANGISGTVTFDPENPGATKGKIIVASASLEGPNSMQNGHLHSAMWLDVAKYPEITFDCEELKNVKTSGNTTTADAAGTFTLKGISKEMTIPVKLTYLKNKLGERVPNQHGDLLVIRSNFSIKRSDFNIQPGKMEDKVSDEIDLTVGIAGASPQ